MTEQILQETLQEWLDGMARLQIDIAGMYDLPAPGSTPTSTLFLLEGKPAHLAQLWQLTKQLEALPIVSFLGRVGRADHAPALLFGSRCCSYRCIRAMELFAGGVKKVKLPPQFGTFKQAQQVQHPGAEQQELGLSVG